MKRFVTIAMVLTLIGILTSTVEVQGCENEVILWSQPILTGRVGPPGYLENGMATLLVLNVSSRSIVINTTFYDMYGNECANALEQLVEPGHIFNFNCFNGGMHERRYMYCNVCFFGRKKEIHASLVINTVEGPLGEETHMPVYSVTLK